MYFTALKSDDQSQVLGFMSVYIQNNGKLGLGQAFRTAKGIQGLGIAPDLTQQMEDIVRKKFPQVSYKYLNLHFCFIDDSLYVSKCNYSSFTEHEVKNF